MKKGQVVTIYEDPITQTKVEGQARLLRKECDLGDGLEYWAVKFLGYEDITLHRTIKAK